MSELNNEVLIVNCGPGGGSVNTTLDKHDEAVSALEERNEKARQELLAKIVAEREALEKVLAEQAEAEAEKAKVFEAVIARSEEDADFKLIAKALGLLPPS